MACAEALGLLQAYGSAPHNPTRVQVLEAQGKSVVMLLYLNKDTWAAQPGVLEHDVRATHSFAHGLGAGLVRMASNMRELRRMGSSLENRGAGAASTNKIRIVLVHEADPAKGGCEFGTFFGTTPQGLIDEGIYKEIAIALHRPPHRSISLTLVAQALGATKDAARLAARQGSINRFSFSSFSANRSGRGGGGAAEAARDVELAAVRPEEQRQV